MIDLKKIYLFACGIILIIVSAGVWNLITVWPILNLPSKISSIAGLVFQAIFFLIFYNMYKTTPSFLNDNQTNKLLERLKEK